MISIVSEAHEEVDKTQNADGDNEGGHGQRSDLLQAADWHIIRLD